MAEEARFVRIHKESVKGFGHVRILVDTETGVQYAVAEGGGMTVLRGEDGKPAINEKYKRK